MKSNTKKLQAEIAKVLQDKYDYIGKLDAIKFIKKEFGTDIQISTIVSAYHIAYA